MNRLRRAFHFRHTWHDFTADYTPSHPTIPVPPGFRVAYRRCTPCGVAHRPVVRRNDIAADGVTEVPGSDEDLLAAMRAELPSLPLIRTVDGMAAWLDSRIVVRRYPID